MFKDLFTGNWTKYFEFQSEADLALMKLIKAVTLDKNKAVEIFRMSALGQRAKAKREDYINYLMSN